MDGAPGRSWEGLCPPASVPGPGVALGELPPSGLTTPATLVGGPFVPRPAASGRLGGGPGAKKDSYLVDSASSHMLVSKIKPCMSKYKQLYGETANGSLNQLSFI